MIFVDTDIYLQYTKRNQILNSVEPSLGGSSKSITSNMPLPMFAATVGVFNYYVTDFHVMPSIFNC